MTSFKDILSRELSSCPDDKSYYPLFICDTCNVCKGTMHFTKLFHCCQVSSDYRHWFCSKINDFDLMLIAWWVNDVLEHFKSYPWDMYCRKGFCSFHYLKLRIWSLEYNNNNGRSHIYMMKHFQFHTILFSIGQ